MENYIPLNREQKILRKYSEIGVTFTRKVNNSNLDILDFKVVYILINLFRIKLL